MNRLREVRTETDCRLLELAARAKCSPSLVHSIEVYDHDPRPATKRKIAAALGVDVEEIWPGEQQTGG